MATVNGPVSPPPPPGEGLWTRLSRAHAIVPLVLVCVFAVVAPAAWQRFSDFNGKACPTSLPPDNLWPTGAFTAITFAFLLGGLLGKLPHRQTDNEDRLALFVAQVGLTIFMSAITLAWWYETRAIANPSALHPITYYIMCVKNTQNDWTLLVFVLGALIVGRWLWHRPGTYF